MPVTINISEKDYDSENPNHKIVEYDGILFHLETKFIGCVLDTGERNGYDNSDFYAIVWSHEQNKPITYTYASTNYWSYLNSAKIDATDEVKELYQNYYKEQQIKLEQEKAERIKQIPFKYSEVRVVKGRKVKIGTEGRVFWFGPNPYSRSRITKDEFGLPFVQDCNIGIELLNGEKIFLSAANVEVIKSAPIGRI